MQQVFEATHPLSVNAAKARASSPLRVVALGEEAEFDALREEWDQLLDDSDQGSYFLRWDWNRLWWRTYAPRGARLYLIVCRDESGRLMGLAPFYWRQHRTLGIPHVRELVFLCTGTEIKTSEYLDIVIRRGYEQPVAEAMAGFLIQRDDWDRLWLWGVVSSSAALSNFQRAMGQGVQTDVCDKTRWVDTSTDWETFRQSLGRASRKHFEQYARRLAKTFECQLRSVRTEVELEEAMDALVRLHQARWQSKGEPGSFALPQFEEFFREIVRISLGQGRLRLWTLSLDNRIVSAQAAFYDRGIAYIFQGGFDPAYADYSIGSLIFWLCIKDCIESGGVREFDFMGGGAAYKESWTKNTRDLVEMRLMRPGLRSSFYNARERSEDALRSFWRGIVPDRLRAARREWLRQRAMDRANPGGALTTESDPGKEGKTEELKEP